MNEGFSTRTGEGGPGDARVPLSSVCSFVHLNLLFLLASLRYGFFFATLPRSPASRSLLFTVDVDTGVLRVLQ